MAQGFRLFKRRFAGTDRYKSGRGPKSDEIAHHMYACMYIRVVPLPVNFIWLTLPVNLPVITANYQKIKK